MSGENLVHVAGSMKKLLKAIELAIFPPPKGEKESLLRHALRALPLIVLLTVACHFLDHNTPLLRFFEQPAMDVLLRSVDPLEIKYTLLVDINDSDFVRIFQRQRPLDATKLAGIIRTIAKGKPRLIVVDLDTEDSSYAVLKKLEDLPCKIVWARDAVPVETAKSDQSPPPDQHAATRSGVHGEQPAPNMTALPVLGDRGKTDSCYGFAITQSDANGWVRSYPKYVNIDWSKSIESHGEEKGHGDVTEEETLPWKAVRLSNVAAGENVQPDDPAQLMFRFSALPENYPGFSVGDVENMVARDPHGWEEFAKNRIILLGATYRACGDFHMTPLGCIEGVKLIGFAIESHLQNNNIRPVNPLFLTVLDIALGLCCLTVAHYLSRRVVLFVVPFIFPLIVFAFSYFTFDKLSVWTNFVPLIFGIYIHLLHDHFSEDRELLHELNHLRQQVATLSPAQSPEHQSPEPPG